MLTTLVDEEACLNNEKREYQEKVLKRLLIKLIKLRLIHVRVYLRIGSCLACVYRVMDALGKFGEHSRS